MHFWQHNTPFPWQRDVFFQQLSEESDRVGFHLQAGQAFGGMNDADKEELFHSLKSCYDLSVHVSPLVLLGSVPGSGFNILRSKLIQVSCFSHAISPSVLNLTVPQWGLDLGPKPQCILDAEQAIWSVIMGIALGQDSSELLKWFVQSSAHQFENLQVNAENIGKYFLNGTVGPQVNPNVDDEAQSSVQESGDPIPAPGEDVDMLGGQATEPEPHPSTPATHPESGPSSPNPNDIVPTPPVATVVRGRSTSPMDSTDDHRPGAGPPADEEVVSQTMPAPARSGSSSPLSELSEREDEDAALTLPEVRSSGRTVKTPGRFTSGAALTKAAAPPTKKRKLQPSREELAPGPVTVAMKEEELYWETAIAHISAAVSSPQEYSSLLIFMLTHP